MDPLMIRASVEEILVEPFVYSKINDEIFERFDKKAALYSNMAPENRKGTMLFAALKRK